MSRDALVVGINNYQDGNLRNLNAPGEDSEAIARTLEEYGEFNVKRSPEAIDPETRKPYIAKTQEFYLTDLEDALVELFIPESKQAPDTALFYFSGHGLRKNKRIQEGFLCTSDVNPQISFNGLSLRWLRELLQNSPIKQQIIILDCCHSGEILNFNKYDPGDQGLARDRCFIAASREFESSYEDLRSNYSVLTRVLLDGLDPNRCPQQWITNYSLIEFINQNLKNQNQRPVFTNFGQPINLTHTLDSKIAFPKGTSNDICPYKGLEYFDCNDHDPKYFYGREKLTDKLLDRVRQNNFLAILGASGSGKSSVLRAGLLHQVQLGRKLAGSEDWKIKIMLPGENPLQSLAVSWLEPNLSDVARAKQLQETKSLLEQGSEGLITLVQASTAHKIILVVDQFEEVFTLCEDLEERETFFQCLLEALEQIDNKFCLILAMRIDFFGKCFERKYSGLGNKIQAKDNFIAIPPMKREELKQAIIKPAEKVNLTLESGLTETLLKDIENSPGSLPLLEDTLTELWKRRENNQLKFTAYSQLGGIGGTLNQRATEVYHSLPPQEQETAQHIFLSLTTLGEGTEDTRRRVLKQDLITAKYQEQLIDNVIQKLANKKLIITRDKAKSNSAIGKQVEVDVAHEALIRNWLTLRQWLEENRDYLRQKRKIDNAAQEWSSSKKNPDYLLQGARLIEAESYLQNYQNSGMLDEIAEEFIAESQKLRTKQEQEQENRRQEELDNLEARRKAEELAKVEAEKAQREAAKAQREAAKAQREAEQREQDQRQANKKLRIWSTLAVTVGMVASFLGVNSYFNSQKAELKQQAAYLKVKLSLSNQKEHLWEAIKLAGGNKKFNQTTLKLSSKVVPEAQSVLYQAVQNSREISTFNGHQSEVRSVAFSPDGKYLVSGSSDNTVKLWDVENNSEVHTFNGHQSSVNSVAFSPDGKYLVSGSYDNTVKLWSLENNSEVHTFNGHQSSVNSVAFSPDGKYLVSGSYDKTVKLWSVENNSEVHTFNGHQSWVNSVAFSPDGKYLVSGSSDNTVKLWSLENNSEVHTFNGHQSLVNSVAFSPDGKYLVSGSGDKTVKLWRVTDWQDWLTVGCERIKLHPDVVSRKTDLAKDAADTCIKYGGW